MPPVPYDACDQRSTRVTSLSLVRDRRNDYSVPTAYGHRAVVVKGDVDEVVIVCGSEEIARQRRSYDREGLIFDPRHSLALLERKTGALDHAAPLVGWALPEEFLRLRRLLEARLGQPGTREYVQVLRRLEDFRLAHVRSAVRDALTLGSRCVTARTSPPPSPVGRRTRLLNGDPQWTPQFYLPLVKVVKLLIILGPARGLEPRTC